MYPLYAVGIALHYTKYMYLLYALVIALDLTVSMYPLCAVGPGHVTQSVTCLATDASLTADPGVASLITALSHTFVKIDHEITNLLKVILLTSAESFKDGLCQLQAKVCA